MKRRLLAGTAVLAVAFLILNAIAYRHAYAMMHFAKGGTRTEKAENLSVGEKITVLFCGVDLPRPRGRAVPSLLGSNCQPVVIKEASGITLGAWACQQSQARPLVILFHGYDGEKSAMIPNAKPLLKMGCSVLLVDFRGSGESSENYTTVGYVEAEDVAAAVKYAESNMVYSKLILYGSSMGAAAVLRAVDSCSVHPDAIVAEGVFDNMLTTVKHRFELMGLPSFPAAQLLVFWGGVQGGFNGFALNPVQYAASVRCPILFLHGADDPRARASEARRVFEAVPAAKQFREFPGLRHQSVVTHFPDEWRKSIGDFLSEVEKAPTMRVPLLTHEK